MARATAAAVMRGRGDADVVVASGGLSDRIWPESFRVISQHGDGFEERFLGVLRRIVSEGYQRIVAVGIDTPALTPADVRRAVESDLEVVGPSRDGGFYLIGLRSTDIELLAGLPWRTDRVLSALVARLRASTFLPVRRDVDDARDAEILFRLLDRLARTYCGRALRTSRAPLLPERAMIRVSGEIIPPGHRAQAPPHVAFS